MWKRIAITQPTKCKPCGGTGIHAICGRPGVTGCSCDGTGKCPPCEGKGERQKEAMPWPQTMEEFTEHSNQHHPEIANREVVGPDSIISGLGHSAETAHDDSDHIHVGYPPKRFK